MNSYDKDMIDALSEYIRIDTSNPPGDCSDAASFLEKLLNRHGLSASIDGINEEKPSIMSSLGGEGLPGLVLIHHMDVVPAREDEWSFHPFSGEVRDGYVLGRGTLDTKGLGMIQLFGTLKARKEMGRLNKKVFFVANPDEEIGGDEGAGYFVDNKGDLFRGCFGLNEGGIGVKDLFGKGDYFLVNMWEKGPLWLRLLCRGKAGHGSRPSREDATARLVKALDRLMSFRTELELTEPVRDMLEELSEGGVISFDDEGKSSLPSPDKLREVASFAPEMEAIMKDTVAITMLDAGFKPNVIPAVAEASIDVRILPGKEPDVVIEEIRRCLEGLDVLVEMIYGAHPSGSPRTGFFSLIQESIGEVYPGALSLPYLSTGFTDSRYYRNAGVVTYGILPGVIPRHELGRIHGVDERISVQTMIEASEVVKKIVMKMETEDI